MRWHSGPNLLTRRGASPVVLRVVACGSWGTGLRPVCWCARGRGSGERPRGWGAANSLQGWFHRFTVCFEALSPWSPIYRYNLAATYPSSSPSSHRLQVLHQRALHLCAPLLCTPRIRTRTVVVGSWPRTTTTTKTTRSTTTCHTHTPRRRTQLPQYNQCNQCNQHNQHNQCDNILPLAVVSILTPTRLASLSSLLCCACSARVVLTTLLRSSCVERYFSLLRSSVVAGC